MKQIERLPDWPEGLIRTLDVHRAHDFEWGKWDCATLFIECVRAMTGEDPTAKIRPSWIWRSKGGALRAVKWAGFDSMRELTAALFPEVPPMLARRGDLVFTNGGTPITSPAICVGAEMHTRDIDHGWMVLPMEAATAAFRVGA